MQSNANNSHGVGAILVDLAWFIAAMYLIRQVSMPGIGYMGNVLLNSGVTLVVATWRLRIRGLSWKNLGLRRPENLGKAVLAIAATFGLVLALVIFFETVIREQLPASAGGAGAPETQDTRFEGMAGNLPYFLSIISLVWIESALEELLDRGFLLTWIEKLFANFSPAMVATVFAVIVQAAIFGFRHAPTHGISGAMVTALIGLAFGIAYVAFGRNLWPLIVAHCILNSMSMVDRFLGTA